MYETVQRANEIEMEDVNVLIVGTRQTFQKQSIESRGGGHLG
jgi:hypothetical protein